jgi:hypothetical protein
MTLRGDTSLPSNDNLSYLCLYRNRLLGLGCSRSGFSRQRERGLGCNDGQAFLAAFGPLGGVSRLDFHDVVRGFYRITIGIEADRADDGLEVLRGADRSSDLCAGRQLATVILDGLLNACQNDP